MPEYIPNDNLRQVQVAAGPKNRPDLCLPNTAMNCDKNPAACFIPFDGPVSQEDIPQYFNDPFSYQPHPLCLRAIRELEPGLQAIETIHDFGTGNKSDRDICGKMFGVLIVQKHDTGETGYLAAFSGKLAGSNHHRGFVPPVFDILEDTGFFRRGEAILNEINRETEQLENSETLLLLQQKLQKEISEADTCIRQLKETHRTAKAGRDTRRMHADEAGMEQLRKESARDHFEMKDLKRYWKIRIEETSGNLEKYTARLNELKEKRRSGSAALQQQIFDHYSFLNVLGERKSLGEIFMQYSGVQPPAGAGECAGPKLLQYAFVHRLKPVAMAEFWWGASPVGEIRRHGHFYPACRGKCLPILGHMLKGMEIEHTGNRDYISDDLAILYEDEHIVVINKPSGLLSVPGKEESDSVYTRIRKRYPDAKGSVIVHRLDMSTSGLMLIALDAEAHRILQQQFLTRDVKKRYTALLDGIIREQGGTIDLPLRVDLDDRPRQMVCHTHGKAARTHWHVSGYEAGKTRIHFFPVTGRTHQLRVHAAHPDGLDTPIEGDELYGTGGARLHLHADRLQFTHPASGVQMAFEAPDAF